MRETWIMDKRVCVSERREKRKRPEDAQVQLAEWHSDCGLRGQWF